MKKLLLISLMTAAGICSAQESARVISSTPIMQQVNAPRQVCTTEQVVTQNRGNSNSGGSGVGTILGGLVGAGLGNQVGQGNGKTVATVLGGITGAMVGNDYSNGSVGNSNGGQQVQNVQNCRTENQSEQRVVGYNVTYEFNGKQYGTQLPGDPGQFVDIKIVPSMPSGRRY